MTKWEYRMELAKYGQVMDTLTALGEEGWELVSVEDWGGSSRLIFKRPKA